MPLTLHTSNPPPPRIKKSHLRLCYVIAYLPDGWMNHSDCKTTILVMVGIRRQQMYVGSATVEKTYK